MSTYEVTHYLAGHFAALTFSTRENVHCGLGGRGDLLIVDSHSRTHDETMT